jgi:hypothetical protein
MAGNDENSKIWQDAVSATKDCPGVEVLEKVMEGAPADPKAQQHVVTCPHCQSEIALLKTFLSAEPAEGEGAAVAWIAAQLAKNQQPAQIQKSAPVIPFWRSMFRLPYMAAAAALFIALGLGISFFITQESGKQNISHDIGITPYRDTSIHLTGEFTQAPEQLSWDAVQGASSYVVEVTEADLDHTLVWKGQSNENSITVTPELKAKMKPGKPLDWKVTALDASGKELARGEGRFRVKKPASEK